MGSWNQTCGLSNLPIGYNDPVTVFLLEPGHERMGAGGYCYSDDVFRPLFIPLVGRYNDYGGVEDIQPGSEIVLALFQKKLAKRRAKAGSTKQVVKPNLWIEEDKYDKSTFETMEELVKIIERGRLNCRDFSGTEGTWGFVMFHTHIYQAMIDRLSSRVPYNQNRTFGELSLAKYKQLIADRKKNPDVFWMSDDFRGVTGMMSGLSSELLEMMFEYNTVEEAAEICTEHILIREVMALLRKGWMPQAGQGSQNSEYALHQTLHKVVEEHIAYRAKEYGEDTDIEVTEDFGEETLFWH